MDYSAMSGSELVKAFNELAAEATAIGMEVTPVKRFKTREDGLRRVGKLDEIIRERKGVDTEEPPPERYHPEDAEETTKPVKKIKNKKAKQKKMVAAKEPKQIQSELAKACNVRSGSILEKIIIYLEERLGEQVDQNTVMKHIYGYERKTNRFLHLKRMMKSAKGYILKQEKDEKGVTSYGLYKVNGEKK